MIDQVFRPPAVKTITSAEGMVRVTNTTGRHCAGLLVQTTCPGTENVEAGIVLTPEEAREIGEALIKKADEWSPPAEHRPPDAGKPMSVDHVFPFS